LLLVFRLTETRNTRVGLKVVCAIIEALAINAAIVAIPTIAVVVAAIAVDAVVTAARIDSIVARISGDLVIAVARDYIVVVFTASEGVVAAVVPTLIIDEIFTFGTRDRVILLTATVKSDIVVAIATFDCVFPTAGRNVVIASAAIKGVVPIEAYNIIVSGLPFDGPLVIVLTLKEVVSIGAGQGLRMTYGYASRADQQRSDKREHEFFHNFPLPVE
jgi:hypothetical protein